MDPSEEVHEILDKVEECDPLTGIRHLAVNADERYDDKTNQFVSIFPRGSAKKNLHVSTII